MADSQRYPADDSQHEDVIGKVERYSLLKGARNRVHDTPKADRNTMNQNAEKKSVPAIYLPRQAYIVWLVLAYAAMLCSAWIILAWTSKRPFGRHSYNCFDANNYCRYQPETQAMQNDRTLRFVANAQTLHSAVSLLTIPLTSAVCAAAVVPWLQHTGRELSVRQVMTLADKGWMSPYVYARLMSPSGWNRYGSSFIGLAVLLNGLGAALSPAITRLTSPQNIKVPTAGAQIAGIADSHDLVTWPGDQILPLRDALNTAMPSDYQARLWQYSMPNCSHMSNTRSWNYDWRQDVCSVGGLTYETLAGAPGAWISQLPNGFSSGVKTKQVIPRINSSVSVDRLNQMPAHCKLGTTALTINHAGQAWEYVDVENKNVMVADWWIKVCMPTYSSGSPYADTTDMQTVEEVAYIDFYSMLLTESWFNVTLRISINTTLGNFELPNYLLNDQPGRLMEHWSPPPSPFRRRSEYDFPAQHNESTNPSDLETTESPGPLLATIYALFGDGSLPDIWSQLNATYNRRDPPSDGNLPCLAGSPLYNLASPWLANTDYNSQASSCLRSDVIRAGAAMWGFLYTFNQSTSALENVFRAAAYMHHDTLFSQASSGAGGLVEYDAGADLQKPGLSDNSIIGLSIAIAVFLLCLLSLAFYASFSRTWTSALDAYAMLRIGAELGSEAVPFLAIRDPDKIVELDNLPGWVGDSHAGGKVGHLGVGYQKDVEEIDAKKRYMSYPMRLDRGSWRMFEYHLDGLFGCWGRRNTKAGLKARRVYTWFGRGREKLGEYLGIPPSQY